MLSTKGVNISQPGSIFLNQNNDICLFNIQSGPCVKILQRQAHRPSQANIPLTEKDLYIAQQGQP